MLQEESPEGLLKQRELGPTFRVSDLVGLGYGLHICIDKFQGLLILLDQETLLELPIWEIGSHWKGLGRGNRARALSKKDLFSWIGISHIPYESVRTAACVKSRTVGPQYSSSCLSGEV